ncbi:MAG: DUF6476 family protein [Alphaproteobacteria bacterium]|nr:DUF6476 family protein [Alphaproteobacteria bacterium]
MSAKPQQTVRTDPVPPSLHALKLLVIIMGVLIVAGVITIGVTVYNRMSSGASQSAGENFGTVSARLPAGHAVHGISAAGNSLYIHLQALDGSASVLVIDGRTGRQRGRIALEPHP